MNANAAGLSGLDGLSSLDDPVRRRLYTYVSSHDEPVSREDAATAAGVSRTLAAYHLDKLTEAGLLTPSYARPAGRGGPGAGRPAKLYARAERELVVSVPPRNYLLLAGLLTEAIGNDDSGTVRAAIRSAAYEAGRATGRSVGDVMSALRDSGYEPATSDGGDVELRNCPFHQLAQQHAELVCGLNRHLLQGLLDGSHARHAHACLHPRPGRCCVVIRDLFPAQGGRRRHSTGRQRPDGDHG